MKGSSGVSARCIWFILATVVVTMILIGVGFQKLTSLDDYNRGTLDSSITAVVYRHDGTVDKYDRNIIKEAVGGDQIEYRIPIPAEKYYKSNTLCTQIYNCRLEAFCENELIYEYGKEVCDNGGSLGNILVAIDLPDKVFGKDIILRAVVVEGSSKAIPHKDSAADAPSIFSSDCAKRA